MNFLRKFGDLIDSLDKDPSDATGAHELTSNSNIHQPLRKSNFVSTDPIITALAENCSVVNAAGADNGLSDICSSQTLSPSAINDMSPCTTSHCRSPFALEGKIDSIDDSPHANNSLVSRVALGDNMHKDAEDACCHCADLRKKLAARQAACVVRDSEAKRQVRQIETLEAALKAEKCRTRVAQGAVESAEKRALILEREVSQGKLEIVDLKSRIALLELKLDLDCQEAEELTSDVEPLAGEHTAQHKHAVMTINLDQDQDEVRSSAGGIAAAEISRLKASLRESQAMVEAVRAQQLRLTEGMDAELKLRDAELAMRDAEISALRGLEIHSNDELGEDVSPIREIIFAEPGTLGIEFEEMEAPFFVHEVIFGTQAEGRLRPGDHFIDIDGARADEMTWTEFVGSMKSRPVTVHVQHVSERANKPVLEKQAEALERRVEAAWGTVCSFTERAKGMTAKAVTSAITELKDLAKESQPYSVVSCEDLPVAV